MFHLVTGLDTKHARTAYHQSRFSATGHAALGLHKGVMDRVQSQFLAVDIETGGVRLRPQQCAPAIRRCPHTFLHRAPAIASEQRCESERLAGRIVNDGVFDQGLHT